MDKPTHLVFDYAIGKTKPVTITAGNVHCPFCDREHLEGIIAQDGPALLLYNKYPVLQDAVQTVLIETYDCQSELSLYTPEHLHNVIRFGVEQWQEMERSGQFQSVMFYKNHGPYSGGTIRHPHMQIVGLKHIDYRANVSQDSLFGYLIVREPGVELNLADKPQIGFIEFNIRLESMQYIDRMADYIQRVAHFILNHLYHGCNSYNLFFYEFDGVISAKLMPRYVTSPLYMGYGIPQVSTRATEVMDKLRRLYFE